VRPADVELELDYLRHALRASVAECARLARAVLDWQVSPCLHAWGPETEGPGAEMWGSAARLATAECTRCGAVMQRRLPGAP